MNKALFSAVVALAAVTVNAGTLMAGTPAHGSYDACGVVAGSKELQPAGYMFGKYEAPDGTEWQSPMKYALNKQLPHALFFSFPDVKSALGVLPYGSKYYYSLDGQWNFHWAPDPDSRAKGFEKDGYSTAGWDKIEVPASWNVAGIQHNGTYKYGVPMYINQSAMFYHEVAVDDWRKGVMRKPPENWTAYKYRNEVGSYVRTFSVPESWKGRRIMINFDGVDSFFYLWINGQYVGFSKNSRNLAQFDITDYLRVGENRVAVEVYRNSDGSFLENQDMFRMAGIIRSVYLTSVPQTRVSDLVAVPDVDANNINAALGVTASVLNMNKKTVKGCRVHYALYPVKLYSDSIDGEPVAEAYSQLPAISNGARAEARALLTVINARLWSAEAPWRYVIVAELLDKHGKVIETVSSYTGFRKVEIRDTPAPLDEFGRKGRYFYVNGKTVKFKGVNRHETCAETGHAITRQQMLNEIMLMKRANINHVRTSHYPDCPYWYYLCDKYGIYLESEANIESHLYYYGKESLSHVPEFQFAHVAREMEMVHSLVNVPSIVIWSLGNEAGPGDNFKACYTTIKSFDSTRPIQYERNNDIVDMGSNQYPSVDWVKHAASGKADVKYPFHISEYGHSMGNATGNLADYWKAIESTNFVCGGAIWEWVDHGLYNYTADGKRYIAYGGDFGDVPNDGTFCLDGLMFADFTPKPQYYEVKKVYQNIAVSVNKPLDAEGGRIMVMNKNYFEPARYDIKWTLYEDGLPIANGALDRIKMIPPRTKLLIPLRLDLSSLKPQCEYFVKLQFLLPEDMPWAKKGYVQAEEQLSVRGVAERKSFIDTVSGKAPLVNKSTDAVTVSGKGFEAKFDNATGTLSSLKYNGKDVIVPGCGPKIDAFRAPMDNDGWAYGRWYAAGLNNLKQRAVSRAEVKRSARCAVISYNVVAQAPQAYKRYGGTSRNVSVRPDGTRAFCDTDFMFKARQTWTVYPDGSVELKAEIASNDSTLALPRLGYVMRVPESYDCYSYYGRGPQNNYNDRCTSQFIEVHSSTVKEQFVPFGKPQSMSNNEDVRWCSLTDASGSGVAFFANGKMSSSALAYSEQALDMASHPFQLPPSGDTYLHLDCGVTGVGGNSCGPIPLESDIVRATTHEFSFMIRPVDAGNAMPRRQNASNLKN